jgi:hypothetical protein
MAKMNWGNVQSQNRTFRYGLEIDPQVGADPNKAPPFRSQKGKKKKKVVVAPVKKVFVPEFILRDGSRVVIAPATRLIAKRGVVT